MIITEMSYSILFIAYDKYNMKREWQARIYWRTVDDSSAWIAYNTHELFLVPTSAPRLVHIKEPLLLIGKSSLCGGSGFPFSLSEWSLTICLTPYNRR